MRALLKELRKMGKTILVSSHILPELADICNKIGIIERGQLLFDGTVDGMCVNCSLPDPAEAKRVFDALSEAGQVQVPLGETFFSPAFGMCTDRFGVEWMVNVAGAQPEG